MKKEYKRMTCISENSIIIKCLWPEQGNNSPLLRKDAQEIFCFSPQNKILLMKSIGNFKNQQGMTNMLSNKLTQRDMNIYNGMLFSRKTTQYNIDELRKPDASEISQSHKDYDSM